MMVAFIAYITVCLWAFPLSHTLDTPIQHVLRYLEEIMEGGLGVNKFQEHLNNEGVFTKEKVNWEDVASELAKSLRERLHYRQDLINHVVSKIQRYHKAGAPLPRQQCCKIQSTEQDYNPTFRRRIDLTSMCYARAPSAPKESNHIEAIIVEQWRYNLENFPAMLWQYFGSVDGYTYIYPASPFIICGSYDPRLRPWYAAALSFKKVVIFVIDQSPRMGSCVLDDDSRCLDVMIKMISTLLDTLTSNDYIAMLTFDEHAYYPKSIDGDECFSTELAIATKDNKRVLIKHLQNIDMSGKAKSIFSKGIDGVHRYLEQVTEDDIPIIVFISSTPNTEKPDILTDTIREVKESVKDLIINTYYVGRISQTDRALFKDMSSTAGHGVFAELNDKWSYKSVLGDFYQSLAFKLGDHNDPAFTQPYLDIGGLGFLSTVSKAVVIDGTLYGVAAMDIPLADLFTDIAQYGSGDTYAFLIDILGKAISHPLLPNPSELLGGEIVDVNIEELEPGAAVKEQVLEAMKQQKDGSATVYTEVVTSKGFTARDGIKVQGKNLTYHFRKVKHTKFSLAVVTVGDTRNTHKMRTPIAADKLAFTYHNAVLQNKNIKFCKQFFQKALKTSAVKFAPKAYLHPYTYQDTTETSEQVKILEQIVRGQVKNNNFTEGVLEDVQLTHYLDELWSGKDAIVSSYAGWRYIGTEQGVMRLFPGLRFARNYDPTSRPWYKRALMARLEGSKITVSSPYLDALGAGYVVSLSQVVTDGKSPNVFGVMAIDLPVHYFHFKILEDLETCNKDNFICFAMDSSGFIISHPSWFNGEYKLQEPFHYENIHIVDMEPDIAADMYKKNHVKETTCIDLFNMTELHFTEVVRDEAHHISDAPYYEYLRTPGTNMYLVRKSTAPSNAPAADTCQCAEECLLAYEGDESKDMCECPCVHSIKLNNACKGLAFGTNYTHYPCSVDVEAAHTFPASKKELSKLPYCNDVRCKRLQTQWACHSYVSCRWCSIGRSGRWISPYCGEYDECYFGEVGHPSPYLTDRANSLQTSLILLLLTALLSTRL